MANKELQSSEAATLLLLQWGEGAAAVGRMIPQVDMILVLNIQSQHASGSSSGPPFAAWFLDHFSAPSKRESRTSEKILNRSFGSSLPRTFANNLKDFES
ncbi:hypothetical protein QJS04_geneDACA012344 [Acorus gramineus]|uniref:Uncharacterized protein n=1 Tax=Acorus gramineus TaxID=55184 RepID=A0AAV9BAF6_ACOGR|nr:hypothetical protein QJS04_geneDACA012344 [Acorus gramineus]